MEPSTPKEVKAKTPSKKEDQGFLAFSNKVALGGMAVCAAEFVFNPIPMLYPLAESVFPTLALYWGVINGTPWAWKHRRKIGSGLLASMSLLRRGGKGIATVIPAVPVAEAVPGEAKASLLSPFKKQGGGWETELPHPLSELPKNPRPQASKPMSPDWASELISDALKLAGFVFEENVEILDIKSGPTLQQIIFSLPPKVQFTALVKKMEDIKIHLGIEDGFTIMKPGQGYKSAAGFTIPHEERTYVYLRDLAQAFVEYAEHAEIPFILGRDIVGTPRFADVAKLPHMLVAGETGSGKSVGINTIITSIKCVRTPDQVQFILVDPKGVELGMYNGSPYLREPVITVMEEVPDVLDRIVEEMESRYGRLMQVGVRNIKEFNDRMQQTGGEPMPYVVIIIDEFADLKDVSDGDVIDHFVGRLAQKARAAGIHLILGTQSPRASIIKGVVKANIPARICFKVSGGIEYQIAMNSDKERYPGLLGKGDGIAKIDGNGKFRFQAAAIGSDSESTAFIELLTKRSRNQERTVTVSPGIVKQPPKPPIEPVFPALASSRWQVEEEEEAYPAVNLSKPPVSEPKKESVMDPNKAPTFLRSSSPVVMVEEEKEEEMGDDTLERDSQPDELPEEEKEREVDLLQKESKIDPELLKQAVELAEQLGGLAPIRLEKRLKIPMSASIEIMKWMKEKGLLGDYDEELGMPIYIGGGSSSKLSDEDLQHQMKRFICEQRRVNTGQLRQEFGVRRQKVSDTLKVFVQEGFLEAVGSRPDYQIAWDEEEIEDFMNDEPSF
ncbi:FtsK/SpoIIIE domain-containing protein [Paenibacillus bovis]|uniref:DNA translocase n=1 Tax=Paenibacillus bovis TaxID=1616788 RepID=A0A1X9T4H4_9BACL|nr:FtsK/SpoIIIE domain-containing protein [Paenibacillus bovis]ARR10732.1 DNA translocase [Paenibacillus bovis]